MSAAGYDLTNANSYRVESCADICFTPRTKQNLLDICRRLNGKMPILLGSGSNVILSLSHYHTPVILMSCFERTIENHGDFLLVGGGVLLCAVVEYAITHGLCGIERLSGIPGTIGGAVRMNAGAYGQEIGSSVFYVESIDLLSGNEKFWNASDLNFDYRDSIFSQNPSLAITKVALRLNCNEQKNIYLLTENLRLESKRVLAARAEKIPYHLPNAGSVFKRGDNPLPIGSMVEKLGMKGTRVNDAVVSDQHAGIIVNVGFASGRDIEQLALKIKSRVHENFGIHIEMEQIVV